MTRLLFATAFLLGAAAVVWMGFEFAGSHTLAFVVTAVIGGVYLIGIIELVQFRRATSTLGVALDTIPPKTDDAGQWLQQWLGQLDPSLREAVRLRIEGDRVGLPSPVFTPYLVGLLVMLGLLGTFVGMVDTLSGAVVALQGSTELEAIRAGLAAPIQGLGVAFGTSVAGVAASAMLGLVSTLVRRDRMLATRQLEGRIATEFREFSLTHNRQQAFNALQSQAAALPAATDTLQSVAQQLAQMGERLEATLLANQNRFHESTGKRYEELAQMGDRLGGALLDNQELFHEATEKRYSELASAVDLSLRESLAASGTAAGDSIKPAMVAMVTEIGQSMQAMQQQLDGAARDQLLSFGEEFRAANTSLLESFDATSSAWSRQTLELQNYIKQSITQVSRELSEQTRENSASLLTEIGSLLQASEALVQTRIASEAGWLEQQGEHMEQLTAGLTRELASLRRQEEQAHSTAAGELSALQSTVKDHLTQLGKGLEAPMTRLIETASETPRAAAEVIGQLREEISNNVERDNSLLEERQRIMTELDGLSRSLTEASSGQREAIDTLVESASRTLQDISTDFGNHIGAQLEKISAAGIDVAGGATELSSMGEAFSMAVERFNSSNQTMIEHLARVEESMDRSSARSDEQLAYYVAQAREIIDHSMSSQKEIIEDLRGLSRREITAGPNGRDEQPVEAEAG